jgi:hypothetical protein
MKKFNRLTCAIICIFGFALNGYSASRNVNTAAKEMVVGLSKQLKISNLEVSIGNLTLIDSQFSSEFAKNFLIYMESEMISHPDFSDVKPQQVMKTRGFSSMDDDEDEDEEDEKSHKVSMAGKYRVQGDLVFVAVLLRDEKGNRLAEYEVSLNKTAIPWKMSPPNMNKIKAAESQIDTVQKPKSAFRTALQIDKGNSGVYTEGEELKIFFRTEKDCYLKALYIDVNQNRVLIYPTARDSGEALRAGIDHALHANNKFTIQPPFGTEMIIGICSTEKMAATNEVNLGGGFKGYDEHTSIVQVIQGLRGIGVSSRKMEQSETRAYLTTVPKSNICGGGSSTRGIGVSSQKCP